MTTKLTDKTFNSTLKAISKSGEALASMIHEAGMYALEQVNTHGNDGFAVRLIDAMGKKHDVKRVEKWLCHFGKLGIKKGVLCYRNNSKIKPETYEAVMEEADNTPYWELSPQEHHKFTVDYLGMLQGLLKRHETAKQKEAEGIEVEERNLGILDEVAKILKAHQPEVKAA